MEFIELTEIRQCSYCTYVGQTEIVKKHCIPLDLIADITENEDLLPPEGFYSSERQLLSSSTVLLDYHTCLKEISVAENYSIIKEILIYHSHKIIEKH